MRVLKIFLIKSWKKMSKIRERDVYPGTNGIQTELEQTELEKTLRITFQLETLKAQSKEKVLNAAKGVRSHINTEQLTYSILNSILNIEYQYSSEIYKLRRT